MDELFTALDQVLILNRQRNAAIQTINKTTHTYINRVALPLDASTKAAKIAHLNLLFRDQAKTIYDNLNKTRIAAGLPLIHNPY